VAALPGPALRPCHGGSRLLKPLDATPRKSVAEAPGRFAALRCGEKRLLLVLGTTATMRIQMAQSRSAHLQGASAQNSPRAALHPRAAVDTYFWAALSYLAIMLDDIVTLGTAL